ncbi:unnamed protein product [Diatraea saccharalis]|uniref:Purple acid phosphatase n=1 Tax=Diatraea saccharalis TaxID=40085 RepID=A0A9P0C7E9_9NEOP|nr:unnamed protein product [Diatraea saccharalis]
MFKIYPFQYYYNRYNTNSTAYIPLSFYSHFSHLLSARQEERYFRYIDLHLNNNNESKRNFSIMWYYTLLLLLGACSSKSILDNYYQPEQVHISFGAKTNDIVATWSTFNDTESIVRYGVSSPDQETSGSSEVFVDGGNMKRRQWIHRATMKDLKFDTHYVYQVGSEDGWSEQFTFKTPPAGEDWPVRIAIYGDMGLNGSKSLPFLRREVAEGRYDLILHVGDFAYDMQEREGRVGDAFMRLLQPLAARVPYMTCPGNHESAYNFSHYSSRFTMPGPNSNLYYSFDVGPIHFVSISTEVYYFTEYGIKLMVEQYEWLKRDLTIANMDVNRRVRPWVIVFGHRPMYCSNSDDVDCSVEYTRTGFLGLFGQYPYCHVPTYIVESTDIYRLYCGHHEYLSGSSCCHFDIDVRGDSHHTTAWWNAMKLLESVRYTFFFLMEPK